MCCSALLVRRAVIFSTIRLHPARSHRCWRNVSPAVSAAVPSAFPSIAINGRWRLRLPRSSADRSRIEAPNEDDRAAAPRDLAGRALAEHLARDELARGVAAWHDAVLDEALRRIGEVVRRLRPALSISEELLQPRNR